VTAAVLLFALVVCLVAVDLGRVLVTLARAQTAADAAALAAAQELALPSGAEPGDVAAAFATHNGAALTDCRCAEATLEAVVAVELSTGPMLLLPMRSVQARARAVVGAGAP
jgi:secretion/DNA translocation related TadE-like protein